MKRRLLCPRWERASPDRGSAQVAESVSSPQQRGVRLHQFRVELGAHSNPMERANEVGPAKASFADPSVKRVAYPERAHGQLTKSRITIHPHNDGRRSARPPLLPTGSVEPSETYVHDPD